jgi:EAL domain-containing protein (putative c-di-GMP-specific phosphodiesterase class I)
MTSDAAHDADFANDLAAALAADEFSLMYQPEIDLHTSGFAGVEALLRWSHATRGVVQPGDFLPLLEASGDIIAVGRWALRTACYQGAEWHAKGYRFPVAVNVSVQQLRHSDVVEDVMDCLRSSRFDPAHLTLEFSHHALSEPVVLEHLTSLHEHGVRLAIDDVSPGRPDFTELARLPIDILKLDRHFVATNANSLHGASAINQLVRDAQGLNLRVIASGIEDASQRDQLREDHVDVGQGFHFAQPYEVQEIDQFLEDFALFSGRPL